LHVTNCHSCI